MPDIAYNPQVVDHFTNPRNPGRLPDATGIGRAGEGTGGEIMIEISLRVSGDQIERASFRAFGCSASIAAASATTVLLTGRPLAEACRLSPEEIIALLGGLPEEMHYCAVYAARAARAAAEESIARLQSKSAS